jgi:hypothetical protein
VLDVLRDEVDLAIRYGELSDSRLVARPLSLAHPVLSASPDYLRRHGRPRAPTDLANKDLRAARIETHRLFDELRQPPARMSRGEAYAWMARLLGVPTEEAHIASLSYDECVKVQLALEDLLRPPGEKPDLPGAAHWLMQAGIEFEVEPDGRFAMKAGDEVVDYWPDRQTWMVRGELLAQEQEGLHELILFCRRRRPG